MRTNLRIPANKAPHLASPLKRGGGGEELVDFSREDEVVFRKPINGVGEEGKLGIAPAESNVGVMALALSERADFVHEKERIGEVLECESPRDFVIVFDAPERHMRHERLTVGRL